jgi:hypothetical protein
VDEVFSNYRGYLERGGIYLMTVVVSGGEMMRDVVFVRF